MQSPKYEDKSRDDLSGTRRLSKWEENNMGLHNLIAAKILSFRNEFMAEKCERTFLKESAAVLTADFPNPARVGCPDSSRLQTLASGGVRLKDARDLVRHLGTCSDCFQGFSQYKRVFDRQKMIGRYRAMTMSVTVLVGMVTLFSTSAGRSERQYRQIHARTRNYNCEVFIDPHVPDVARKRGAIHVVLPNIDLGTYEVELIAPSGSIVSKARAIAAQRGSSPTLTFNMDLSHLKRGYYSLRLQRDGGASITDTVRLK